MAAYRSDVVTDYINNWRYLKENLEFKCNLGLTSVVLANVCIGFDNFDDDDDWILICGWTFVKKKKKNDN